MSAAPLRETVEAHLAPHQSAHTLLAALHEAGHAVVAAACGLPLASATARGGGGEVVGDQPKARMLADRYKRRNPAPAPRAAYINAQLAMMGWALGGASAVELRANARPGAAWRPHAAHYARMSRGDRRIWYQASEKLRELGVNADQAAPALAAWVDETLTHHRATLARVAVLLLRQRRLTGPELDRLLAPVTAVPEPFMRLIILAGRIMADPAMAWPPEATTVSKHATGPSWPETYEGGQGVPLR